MTNNSKISVIIPTYNREKLIERSIKSVLNQTYKNIEVIVVDDCSTDNTESIVNSIKDDRLIYIRLSENKGACYARNKGIEVSSGKYVAFNDSDDVFYKNKLEKQLKNLLNNNSDLDFCKMKVFHNINYQFPSIDQEKNIKKHGIINELCNGNFISTQTILVKKDVVKDIKFDNSLPRFQDYDLVLRIGQKYNISYTNQILVSVYPQNDSISNSDEKLANACIIMLRKDYGLRKKQDAILAKTLIMWPGKPMYDDLYMKQSNLLNEYNNLMNKYQELSEQYKSIEKELSNIVNSKRWQYINKIMKIIKK